MSVQKTAEDIETNTKGGSTGNQHLPNVVHSFIGRRFPDTGMEQKGIRYEGDRDLNHLRFVNDAFFISQDIGELQKR